MRRYSKLIRDKIPEIIEASGKNSRINTLDDHAYKEALDQKLVEELNEYLEDDSVEELADLVEVIYGILDYKGVSIETFEQIRVKKQRERGGFKKRLFLESVSEK